ncbi:hypothetical protein Naga_100335g5 [Nannochloropsis gaditana]|uniref:Uncharacterized protein n=1 Tax=Nannochloropsis gaditana TaxID=72520 RepID=W7T1D4_9STRA|nr:hypothetical protein Naga_100335g5 [Nannochloropsis gaditana]
MRALCVGLIRQPGNVDVIIASEKAFDARRKKKRRNLQQRQHWACSCFNIPNTSEKKEVDLGRLRALLTQNKALVHAKGRMDEETPLHIAAAEVRIRVLEAVRLLLQAGASPAAVDKAGYTPSHWAAGKGHEKVVEELLKHKADANAVDKNGLTPLHWAAYWGQTACIKELLYKGEADPNAQDHLQHTPFMMAD